jgi:hypothetical protein
VGTFYFFLQADDEKAAEDMLAWLKRDELLPTPDFKPGRTPTYAEIRRVLDQMGGYKIAYHVSQETWDVNIDSIDETWAWLFGYDWKNVSAQGENALAHVSWKGWIEVVQPIAQKLANICGTITISNDSDPNDVIFVYPNEMLENNPAPQFKE